MAILLDSVCADVMYADLNFRYPFRKYQRMILEQIEAQPDDDRYHLVAPPGSGKTIVGLELIRRFDQPAVVFAPTTTIQRQWKEMVGMFTENASQVESLTSLRADQLAAINIFTYQLISTTGESLERINDLADARWVDDLILEGQATDEQAARDRIKTLRENNPAAHRRELAKRYLRVKHELLRSEPEQVEPFLHPNARKLIGELVDHGVRTIVLDECHHLLDYWAIVLRYLIGKISSPRIVGLTATLPNPENETQYENYTALLGDVDFEVPTPAVVKEGDLAPYRDLVYFVSPSPREMNYLRDIQAAFEGAIAELTGDERFQEWVAHSLRHRLDREGESMSWGEFFRARPLFSIAALRFSHRMGWPWPEGVAIPLEAEEELSLEDWATLLERYGLDVLKLSSDQSDHEQLKRLRRRLLPFGLTLTERGLRQSRSPGDLVLTFSEHKDGATAEILAAEAKAMGNRLRAVVITDFERKSSGVRRLRGVLDQDAGSARRVFYHLAHHLEAGKLDPILVTGQTLMADADHGQPLLDRFNRELSERGIDATCAFRSTAMPQVLAIHGKGPGWKPSVYVRLVTRAFEEGLTKCLVGTRGIFGEGWDSLRLNTLIDLTSVTTSTSVQQLRGRGIRLDPTWPRKVAHNWDVVCVAKQFKKGDADLKRFLRRHNRYWGIVPLTKAKQLMRDVTEGMHLALSGGFASELADDEPLPMSGQLSGQVVKGITHVSPKLAFRLATMGFRRMRYSDITDEMLSQVKRRDAIYDLWRIGEEYSNFSYTTTQLETRDLKIRTVHTMQDTLKRMIRSFVASMAGVVLLAAWYGLQQSLYFMEQQASLQLCFSTVAFFIAGGTIVAFAFNFRRAMKIGRALLIEQPSDAILLDVGRALLAALKEARVVSPHLQSEYVRVIEQPDQSYQVLLDYASPEDASVFIHAYRQIFDPIRRQRYLILRDDERLPNLILRALWLPLRLFFRNRAGYPPAYHPVPKILANRKERAEAFARHWKRYVGGGRLVYIHSEEGRRILLEARAQRRPKVKGLAFEVWR